MKNIIVGIEFNDEVQELLLHHAKKLAKVYDAKIWLLHVSAPDPDFVGYHAGPQFIRDQRAEELKIQNKQLTDLANKIQEEGFEAEGLLVQGPTIDTFISESKKLDIDLIILGYHPRNLFYELLFSSKAEDIIRNSKIPLMVIPEV